VSRRPPFVTGPGDDDRCGGGVNTGYGCGHERHMHRTRGTARCMDSVGQPGWRCDCQAFVEPEEDDR
jgi:hypothetical protein